MNNPMIPKPYQVKIGYLPLIWNGIEFLIFECMCIQQVNQAINKWLYQQETNVSKSYVIEVAEKKPGASFLTCLIFAVTMFCLAKACEGKHYHGTNTTQAPVVTLNG